jgi:hypothetical protein
VLPDVSSIRFPRQKNEGPKKKSSGCLQARGLGPVPDRQKNEMTTESYWPNYAAKQVDRARHSSAPGAGKRLSL